MWKILQKRQDIFLKQNHDNISIMELYWQIFRVVPDENKKSSLDSKIKEDLIEIPDKTSASRRKIWPRLF